MSLLDPLSHALAAVVAAAHAGLTAVGAEPAAGATWLLSIAAVVVVVRLALLPLVVHGVRLAHASARARPHLKELAERHRGSKDPETVRRMMEERRRISAEHGVSRLGCLPLLVQLPIWISLYHLLADLADGASVGAMGPDLVASLGAATLMGVPLADRGYLGAGPSHLAVVAGLALTAAAMSFVTQRFLVAPNTVVDGLPEAMASAQQLMPVLSAVGMVVAGGVVPLALIAYWVFSQGWTMGQAAVVGRRFPTPGTLAAQRR
ncbi:membrane protein insertase YidC [Nocardioides sediminis]|uniref:membrane protein insertase YidC n=1 Tax=Nocardioides sediminis TaxID=433648 RepID=UPI000D32116D|nr:membrane protein insertase YidC [Nocardioides sediminis]